MDFVKQYNDKTKDLKGNIIPAVITVYEDRTFTFVTKLPPVSAMIKKVLGLKEASKKPGRETAGTLTSDQIREIAQKKLPDLNTDSLDSAIKSVSGTARSMGIKGA
jgi:large subunit ribosomal protein L11